MSRKELLAIAGGIWVLVGIFLIYRGINLFQLASNEQHASQNAIMISSIVGLIIGGIKGKFVLAKTARKNIARIDGLSGPLKIHHVFSTPFYGFILGMILLGVLLRTFNGYLGGYVVVASIYCGIGMALIIASMVYWKASPDTALEESR
jgi:uncharacterized membrane protein